MARKITKLVIGSGEVYFDPFMPGTMAGEGEIYIGNTPDFAVARDVTTQEIKDSVRGRLIQLEAEVLEEIHTVRFSTDDIEDTNVALWFGGSPLVGYDTPASSNVESITVKRGRYYQLGVTSSRPVGLRGVSDISATKAGNPIDFDANFELDASAGRIHVLPLAVSARDGDVIEFTYANLLVLTSVTRSVSRELWGSIRFVATNDVGPRKSYFYPAVRLKATGDAALKSDVWQAFAFEGEARKISPLAEYVYIDENTSDTDSTVPDLDYTSFVHWEDQLDILINITMPSRGY